VSSWGATNASPLRSLATPRPRQGHGWLGCSRDYAYPDELNADYGVPLGLCAETAPNSGVFVREFTKSTVQMDCATWTPTITFK
jgi:hypothetical protein